MNLYKKTTLALAFAFSLSATWACEYDELDSQPSKTGSVLISGSTSYLEGITSFITGNVKNVSTHVSEHPLESLALLTSLSLPYLPVDAYLGVGAKDVISMTVAGAPLVFRVLQDKTLGLGNKAILLAGGLVVSNAVPTAAAAFSNTGMCELPAGSYLGSCHNTTISPYASTDPHVPPSCVLTAICDTTHAAIGGKPNTLYFGVDEHFTLGNNNGTLMVQSIGGEGTYMTDSSSSSEVVECLPLPGSFLQSCDVTSIPYVATDENLAGASLCEMKTSCETLGGTHSSHVVHYAHQGVTTVVENCDGSPVLHPDSTFDHQCAGASAETIKAIAAKD